MVILGKRHILMGLAGVFALGWVGFVASAGILYREVDRIPAEIQGIVIIILALFGAVNVMLLAAFFMILLLWKKSSIETK